jgi:hypothetical protein
MEVTNRWIDIEGRGLGITDNYAALNASSGGFTFVLQDSQPDGADPNVGAGIETATDLGVVLQNFGADDRIYVDDIFNNSEKVNDPSLEVFAQGNGGVGSGLKWSLFVTGGNGDPQIWVELEAGVTSTDSVLDSVNKALGLAADQSIVIVA